MFDATKFTRAVDRSIRGDKLLLLLLCFVLACAVALTVHVKYPAAPFGGGGGGGFTIPVLLPTDPVGWAVEQMSRLLEWMTPAPMQAYREPQSSSGPLGGGGGGGF